MSPVLKDTLSRALNTFCQTLLAFLTAGAAIESVTWGLALSVSLVAALASILQSIIRHTRADSV